MNGISTSAAMANPGSTIAPNNLQRPLKQLQHLEQKQKVPLRPRSEAGFGGIGHMPQRNFHEGHHARQTHAPEENRNRIFEHLFRKEFLLGLVFIARRGRHAMPADQNHVTQDQQRRDQGQKRDMRGIEPRERDAAESKLPSVPSRRSKIAPPGASAVMRVVTMVAQ